MERCRRTTRQVSRELGGGSLNGKGNSLNWEETDEPKKNGRALHKHAQSYSTTTNLSPVTLFATRRSALRGLWRAG